jgi:hypothetical protein
LNNTVLSALGVKVSNLIQKKIKTFVDLRFNYNELEKLFVLYPDRESATLVNNFKAMIDGDKSFEFLTQIPNGYIELNCPVNNSLSRCQHSLPLTDANALYFNGVEPFYVIQGNFCIEALYYPDSSMVIILPDCYNYDLKLDRLLNFLDKNEVKLSFYYKKNTFFAGFYFFHQSPYHYYYLKVSRLLPALKIIEKLDDVTLYSLPGTSFLDLSLVSNKITHDLVLKNMFTLDENIIQSSFYLSIGEHTRNLSTMQVSTCDNLVKEYLLSNQIYNEKYKKLNSLTDTHFFLWLGLTSGKRAWVEQVLTYKKLIEKVVNITGYIAVILDGWTKGRGFDAAIPRGDMLLANELKEEFKNCPNVVFIDLIAEEAEVKARIALDVDFFVANHATGSIWISRLAGARGITHISNAARSSAIKQHIHPNAELIPIGYVNDIEPEDAQTPFHVSYSINPEKFIEKALPLALEVYNLKRNTFIRDIKI